MQNRFARRIVALAESAFCVFSASFLLFLRLT